MWHQSQVLLEGASEHSNGPRHFPKQKQGLGRVFTASTESLRDLLKVLSLTRPAPRGGWEEVVGPGCSAQGVEFPLNALLNLASVPPWRKYPASKEKLVYLGLSVTHSTNSGRRLCFERGLCVFPTRFPAASSAVPSWATRLINLPGLDINLS